MRLGRVLLAALPLIALQANAQAKPATTFGLDRGAVPTMELGFDYVYLHGNAPPGGCECFALNGGAGSLVVNVSHGWSVLADLSGAHASAINGTPQSMGLFNFLAGGRYSIAPAHRLVPYGQALVGGSEEMSSYAAVGTRLAFAASAGGGLKLTLNHRFAWKVAEADYLYSRLPNGSNDHQNDLRVSSGIILRFGPR